MIIENDEITKLNEELYDDFKELLSCYGIDYIEQISETGERKYFSKKLYILEELTMIMFILFAFGVWIYFFIRDILG